MWADSTGANFVSTGPNQFLIRAAGGVGIGTANPNFSLHVDGSAGKPGGGSWSSSSDRRLKKNIKGLIGSLDKLLALRGVTFEYKDPKSINELPGERIGVVAQEVEPVFPDWVDVNGRVHKTVTFRGFEALTVEALRELRHEKDAEVAVQKAKNEEQAAQISDLTAQLERMEAVMTRLVEKREGGDE